MQRYPKILWVLALLCVLGSGGAQAQPAGPPKDPPAQMPPLAEEVPPAPAEYVARSTRLDDVDTCFSEVRLARSSLPGQVAEPAAGAVTIRRLVLAVDASGSMAGAVRGERKMDAARRAVTQFLADLPPDVEVGLVVFGHRGSPRPEGRAASCASAETVAAIGPANRTEVRVALEGLRPVGWTPLAQGIEHAAGLFAPVETAGEQVLLVVSDGVETCGGDPVATARRLHGGPVRAVVNIIGFDIRDAERARLAAVAEAGGGRFFRAESGNELLERLREAQRENLRRATRARVAAGRDATRTRVEVGRAATRARICVGRALAAERIDLSRRLAADSRDGRLPPGFQAEALALLTERHRPLLAALDAYVEAVEALRDDQLESIERDLRRALAPSR